MNDDQMNFAETVRDITRDNGEHKPVETPQTIDLSKLHVIDLPETRKTVDLTDQIRKAAEYLKPHQRKGTARLSDLDSMITWANLFKGDTSIIFANPDMDAPTMTCIADYHQGGAAQPLNATGDPTARHCHHKAIYSFPLSDEWKAWTEVSGKLLEKDDLGEFVEANAKDILDPTPAILDGKTDTKNEAFENRLIETARKIEGRFGQLTQLLAMSKQFQVHEKSNLTVTSNRDTGESQIQFVNEHSAPDGTPLVIPNLIIIAIPVFQGGAPYRMACRFRYRKISGMIRFILTPYNPEKAFEAAFKEVLDATKEATDLPLLLGQPEQ